MTATATTTRLQIVVVDSGSHAAGWIDDTGRFVNCRWLAATYATEAQARTAMDLARRNSHLDGCDWFVTPARPLDETERAELIEYRRTSAAGDRRENAVPCARCQRPHVNLRIDLCDPCADGAR